MDISRYTLTTIASLLNSEDASDELISALKNDHRAGVSKLLVKYFNEQDRLKKIKQKSDLMTSEERKLWAEGYKLLGGIDEVGRGPLAGPVVAACVILPVGLIIDGVDDSKKLTPAKREDLCAIIMESAISIGIGSVNNYKIDDINIYQATLEAMTLASEQCSVTPDYLLIDALQLKNISIPQLSIISGDTKSQSIAAASIVAKVYRDKEMVKLDSIYPGYGFAKHKGYGTEEHLSAIKALGLTPIHRRSFTYKLPGVDE